MCDMTAPRVIGLAKKGLAKKADAKTKHAPADHHDDLKRVNRLIGQLEGVKRMIDDRRYCVDILNQTRAVGASLRSLEASILRGHMHHCLRHAMEAKDRVEVDEKIEELVELFGKRQV